MAAAKSDKNTPAPSAVPAPADVSPAPVFVADAGALLHRDNAGSPRGRELTEGQANFASFAATLQPTVEAE